MNHVRDLLRRDDAAAAGARSGRADVDVEAGTHGSSGAGAPATNNPPATGTGSDPNGTGSTGSTGAKPLDAKAQLEAFRQLVGITPAPGLDAPAVGSTTKSGSSATKRAAPNVGIYAKVVANEKTASRWYTAYAWIINVGLFVQVLVAAALTAMGAAGVNHAIITAFAAVNTAIAGFHTYLQGYGLPGRLRYYATAWAKVREAIEQRERDFAGAAVYGTSVFNTSLAAAVADIEKLYSDTLTEIENTTPTGFRTTSKSGGSGGAQQPAAGTAPPPGTSPPVQVANPTEKLFHSSLEPSINTQSLPGHGIDAHPPSGVADALAEPFAPAEQHH